MKSGSQIHPEASTSTILKWPDLPMRFGPEEQTSLGEALQSNVLWYWQPKQPLAKVNTAIEQLKQYFGVPYIATTSSGTASNHVAVSAALIPAGSEVITSPITDIGTVAPIVFQNAIPVFADVDLNSSLLTRDSIEAKITENTRAVLVVHLAGTPCSIDSIRDLCTKRGLVLIEDAAQALGAKFGDGRRVGTVGDFGCFSLNDQKHITSGEGGFVISHKESDYYLCHNFADKFYDRNKQGIQFERMALNYRMSELDGAMTIAQLPKLEALVKRRQDMASLLTKSLMEIDGIIPQTIPEGSSAYFFYQFRIDEKIIARKRNDVMTDLQKAGIPVRAGYLPKPMYKFPVFQKKQFFAGGIWPAEVVSKRQYDYTTVTLPNCEKALESSITFTLHQGVAEEHIAWLCAELKKSIATAVA